MINTVSREGTIDDWCNNSKKSSYKVVVYETEQFIRYYVLEYVMNLNQHKEIQRTFIFKCYDLVKDKWMDNPWQQTKIGHIPYRSISFSPNLKTSEVSLEYKEILGHLFDYRQVPAELKAYWDIIDPPQLAKPKIQVFGSTLSSEKQES